MSQSRSSSSDRVVIDPCAPPDGAAPACPRTAPAPSTPAQPCRYPAQPLAARPRRLFGDLLHQIRPLLSSARFQRLPAGASRDGKAESRAHGNNAGPWRRLPAIRLTLGLTAPSSHDVGGQPQPDFHRRRAFRQATPTTNCRAHSTKLVRRRRATTPDFRLRGRPARGYLGLTGPAPSSRARARRGHDGRGALRAAARRDRDAHWCTRGSCAQSAAWLRSNSFRARGSPAPRPRSTPPPRRSRRRAPRSGRRRR